MNEEALELDRSCAQGSSFRLTFRRQTFHRRAQNFAEHRLLAARWRGRLAGVVAVALKDVELHGAPSRAAFLFDLRVDPSLRGRGIARLLAAEAVPWGLARAELAYTYTMSDNRVVSFLSSLFGAREAGVYCYSVLSTRSAGRPRRPGPARSSFGEVHEAMRTVAGPFDLYANPAEGMERGGYAGSWISRRGGVLAGCSAWSNRKILAEVVEAVPRHLRALGAVGRAFPRIGRRLPRIPARGEVLSSWYLFDFFSTDEGLGRELIRHVASEARNRGVDYLYLSHAPGDPQARAARRDQALCPVIPYRLLARMRGDTPPALHRFYVDVRDL